MEAKLMKAEVKSFSKTIGSAARFSKLK